MNIHEHRAQAAERYRDAAAELVAAWAELAAADQAAANSNQPVPVALQTFGATPQVPPHPIAMADVSDLHRDPWGAAQARAAELLTGG